MFEQSAEATALALKVWGDAEALRKKRDREEAMVNRAANARKQAQKNARKLAAERLSRHPLWCDV